MDDKNKLIHKQTLKLKLRILLKRFLFNADVSTVSFRLKKARYKEIIRQLTFRKNKRRNFIKFLNRNYPDISISLLDIGARSGLLYPYIHLSKFKGFYLEGIEPDEMEAKAIMESGKHGNYNKIHTVVLSDKVEKIPLYITKVLGCTSIYKPYPEKMKYYSNSDYYKVLKIIQVQTTTLNNLYKNQQEFDFLALDTQAAEYKIFKGGERIMENSIGLSFEALFSRIYENQPLFSDLHDICLEKGFVLIKMDSSTIDGEIIEIGDCVYVKDHFFIKTKEDLFKRILFVLLWGCEDYVEFLMRNYGDKFLSNEEKNHILKILNIKIKEKVSTPDDGISARNYRDGGGYFETQRDLK